jgi:hypothetical protein
VNPSEQKEIIREVLTEVLREEDPLSLQELEVGFDAMYEALVVEGETPSADTTEECSGPKLTADQLVEASLIAACLYSLKIVFSLTFEVVTENIALPRLKRLKKTLARNFGHSAVILKAIRQLERTLRRRLNIRD